MTGSPPASRPTLFDVPAVKAALWLLLGGGLDDEGKEKWLAWRIEERWSEEDIFADALSLIETVAT